MAELATDEPPESHLVTLHLLRPAAESLLRCLKYYELDNLSENDTDELIRALEEALAEKL